MSDREALDTLINVGFAGDGSAVRARSIYTFELEWRLDPATDDVAALAAEMERLQPNVAGTPTIHPLPAAEPRRLRSLDPGPWPRPEDPPPIVRAANAPPGVDIAARTAPVSELLLDLAPLYNRDGVTIRNTFWTSDGAFRRSAFGVQRIAGVDYDIRGAAELRVAGASDLPAQLDAFLRLDCVPLPRRPVRALSLLSRNGVLGSAPTGTPLATLTFRYDTGPPERVPLLAGRDLLGYAGDDAGAPRVFATNFALPLVLGSFDVLTASRVENPDKSRLARCFDLELLPPSESLLLLAATIEPPDSGSPAVIPAGRSGSTEAQE